MPAAEAANQLNAYILGEGVRLELGPLVEGVALRLSHAGLPLDRFTVSFGLLNATVLAAGVVWRPNRELIFTHYAFAERNEGLYERSPYKVVTESREWLRLDLADVPDGRFGIVPELKADGLRHYVVVPLTDSQGASMYVTMATRGDVPFSSEHESLLGAILPALSAVVEVKTLRLTLSKVLGSYVGELPAREIVNGTVHLGEVREVRAAILIADLRGFTHLSTRLPPQATAEVLNRYYDIVVPAVGRHGGEVLKFIGDAVLAIFPAATTGDDAAALSALAAARDALDFVSEPLPIGTETVLINFGIAVHLGEAVFGNVGSGDRLDFTVIGRDVNVAARIASLCSRLGRPYLVSEAVAAIGQRHGRAMADAGSHTVRGLSEPLRVFVPDVATLPPALLDDVSQGVTLAAD